MSLDAVSWIMAHPSFLENELLMQYNQRSDFMELMAGRGPRVKLGEEDKYVYLRHLGLKTKVSSGQAGANQIPSCSIAADMASAPVYLQQARAEWDHHQLNMAKKWGFSLPAAQSLAMQQAHYQQLRDKALYGMFPGNGEGFLNATGATYTTLPADPFGAQRFSTYDNGAMALFLLGVFAQLKTNTYQLGMPQRFAIIGPQQDISIWQYKGIVQLTSFQRPGGGTATIQKTVEEILRENGDEIVFGYDDTLIGAGAGGTDAIIFCMPEVKKPEGAMKTGAWNTNKWADLQPSFTANTLQYSDVIAPIEITAPLPQGATDVYSEMSATSGWAPRPEALLVLSGAN
jgi:Uncharacterized protein conserved in bacteria (DUF2184)